MVTEARNDNHVGHFFMNQMNMKEEAEEICQNDLPFLQTFLNYYHQIDAATGLQETKRSVLSRSIRLAQSFRNHGLEPGDVLALGGLNHLDVHIPFYAALMTGLPVAGVNPLFKYSDIKLLFKIVEPRIAFCQHAMYEDYQRAVQDLGLETKIVTFDKGECTMTVFMDFYKDSEPEDQFKVTSFDVSKVPCWLASTSGSTGFPKVSALSHSLVLRNVPFFVHSPDHKTGSRRCALNLSSTQWVSACYNVLAMPINQVKLQTSAPPTTAHFIEIINQYKPVSTFSTPDLLLYVLQHETPCDLTCFDVIKLGGAKSPITFLNALRARVRKDTKIIVSYGLTETGLVLEPMPEGPLGNIGVAIKGIEAKLMDPNTGRTISEPNITGELLVKGSRMECYYNNPKATAEAFTKDGFFKTGDLMYRDEEGYYFFVDRLKMLIKYRNYQIVPHDLEEVILTHPAVAAVCVVGVPHPVDEERAAASVMVRAGSSVTAEEVEAHVASQLSVDKHLHGGVVFLAEMPLTASAKIDRNKVKDIVLKIKGEYEY